MGEKSNISWTDSSWNPVTGCSKVSPGCQFCYAETLSLRMGWSAKPWTAPNAAENVVLHPDRLDMPLRWKKPRMVFVNSMSDLFHEQVPDEFISDVYGVMTLAGQHTFQVLTKRPERMARFVREYLNGGEVPGNIWMGTSVEDQRRADERIPHLLQTPAAVRFLSCEPLLGPVELKNYLMHPAICEFCFARCYGNTAAAGWDIVWQSWVCPECQRRVERDGGFAVVKGGAYADTPDPRPLARPFIGWVIAGGESGSHLAKPEHADRLMRPEWARDLRDQCAAAGVAFWMKQHSATRPGQQPYIIEEDGSHTEWHQFPEVADAGQ